MKSLYGGIILLFTAFILMNCADGSHEDAVTIWETDSFTVEVNHPGFWGFLDKKKASKQESDKLLANKIEQDERNIFTIAQGYSEKVTLERWTRHFFNKNLCVFRNKISKTIETDIELRPYSDVGTSGKDVYIRDNYLFKIIEIVY
ncbi:MAG: hypothetical protein GQ574_01360 [Crocinitomix sp.]|nr:hypothetical protein [Crocinitomix sp.]